MFLANIRFIALGLTLAVAACGGGGGSSGGGGGGGGSTNTAPTFTSAATATIPENFDGPFYTAMATDAQGDVVAFSIGAGGDGGLFQLLNGNELAFRTSPDFERPADGNGDNVYELTLAASDGRASTTLALRVTITDVVGGSFQVRRVGTGFAGPVFVAAMPDDRGLLLVVERAGRIRMLDPDTGQIFATPFLDITGQISTNGERGLLGMALAPDYMTSGRAYVFVTAPDGSLQLRRYTSPAGGRDTLDASTGDVLISIPHSEFNNHNGGWIGFDAAGLLYMATGDGGGANDPLMNGQNRNTLLGKVLRLDVSRDDFPADPNRDYGIPPANPFAGGGGAPEVWLYGLRNPFRASFDRATGELWIGDVGQGAIEEVDRVQTSQSGLNLGWPLYEGTQPLFGNSSAGLTMPVTQYGHGTGALQGNSITGGVVYRGPVEQLQGLYIFADFISNNVWSVPIAGLVPGTTAPSTAFTNRNAAFTPNVGTLTGIVAFGEDMSGNLLIVSIGGSVFIIEPSS
jgi:glucose/arabinose dehydrogenase